MGKRSDVEAESFRSVETSPKEVFEISRSDGNPEPVVQRKLVFSPPSIPPPNVKLAPNHSSQRYSSSTISSRSSIATTIPKDKTFGSGRVPIPPSFQKTLFARRSENRNKSTNGQRKSSKSGGGASGNTASMVPEKEGTRDSNEQLEVIDLPEEYTTESEVDDFDKYSRKTTQNSSMSRNGSSKSKQSRYRNRRDPPPREGYGAEDRDPSKSSSNKSNMNPMAMMKSPYGLLVWAVAVILVAGLSATLSTVLLSKSITSNPDNGLNGNDFANTLPRVTSTGSSSSSRSNSDSSTSTPSSSSSSSARTTTSSDSNSGSGTSSSDSNPSTTAAANAAQSSLSGRSFLPDYQNFRRMQRLAHRSINRKRS